MKRNLLEQIILYEYRYIVAYLGAFGVAIASLLWRLNGLLPGLSTLEYTYVSSIKNLGDIVENPLSWPYKLLTLAGEYFFDVSFWAIRAPSIVFASLSLVLFFLIIRHQFKTRVALLSLLLFSTSSWWLSFARLAEPTIFSVFAILLVSYVGRKLYEERQPVWLLVCGLSIGLALSAPMLVYITLAGLIVLRSPIKKLLGEVPEIWAWCAFLLVLVAVAPLIAASIKDVQVFYQLFGLPESGVNLIATLSGIRDTFGELFWSAQAFWPLRLGTLPLLDLFSAVMVILGIYHLDQATSRSLTRFVLAAGFVLTIAINLNPGPLNGALLLPFIYVLISAGIVVLFSQWYTIFPRNPVARITALVPSVFLIIGVAWYHHNRYFIAWPSSPEIVAVAPPITSCLVRLATQHASADNPILVVVDRDELVMAQAIENYADNLEVATTSEAVSASSNVAYTDAAFRLAAQTNPALRESFAPCPTQYASWPVGVWLRNR